MSLLPRCPGGVFPDPAMEPRTLVFSAITGGGDGGNGHKVASTLCTTVAVALRGLTGRALHVRGFLGSWPPGSDRSAPPL